MNTKREIKHDADGVIVVAFTPEEQAKWDDLFARLEQVETALVDAKRVARKARNQLGFYLKYRRAILAQIQPLHQIQFPEIHLRQPSPIT